MRKVGLSERPPCHAYTGCDCIVTPHCDPVACNTNSDRNIAIHIPDYTASQTEYRSLGNSRKYVKIYKNLLLLFLNPYFVGGTCSMNVKCVLRFYLQLLKHFSF